MAAGPLNPPTPGAGVRGVVEGVVLKALRAKGISPGGEARCAMWSNFGYFWLFYDRKTRNFDIGRFSEL